VQTESKLIALILMIVDNIGTFRPLSKEHRFIAASQNNICILLHSSICAANNASVSSFSATQRVTVNKWDTND